MLKLLENSNSVESSFYYSKDVIKRALENGDPVITISGNINEDAAIDLYLLAHSGKIDVQIIKNDKTEELFNSIKTTIKAISEFKKNICFGDTEILKVQLQQVVYPLMSPIGQKIVDRSYMKQAESLKGKHIFVVDSHNFFHRTFHGMPQMVSASGKISTLAKSLTTLLKFIEKKNPDYIIFANEGTSNVNLRKDIYPEYKNRSPIDEGLRTQIKECFELLIKMKIPVLSKEGYEADDIIASIVKKSVLEEAQVTIYSTDKDLMQFMGMPGVKIFNQGLGDYATAEYCVDKLGVEPEHALLAQAIQGDTSDNIPGIPGVGKVTAAKLIEQFGTLEKILEEGPSLKGKLGEKIAAGKDSARISMRLVSLYDDLELDLKPAKIDFSLIKEDLMIYGINL